MYSHEQKVTLINGLMHLAGLNADYATQDNAVGYTQGDSYTAMPLAAMIAKGYTPTEYDFELMADLLHDYRNTQLTHLDLSFTSKNSTAGRVSSVDPKTSRVITLTLVDGFIHWTTPKNDSCINLSKRIKDKVVGFRWNPNLATPSWVVDASKAAQVIALIPNDFTIFSVGFDHNDLAALGEQKAAENKTLILMSRPSGKVLANCKGFPKFEPVNDLIKRTAKSCHWDRDEKAWGMSHTDAMLVAYAFKLQWQDGVVFFDGGLIDPQAPENHYQDIDPYLAAKVFSLQALEDAEMLPKPHQQQGALDTVKYQNYLGYHGMGSGKTLTGALAARLAQELNPDLLIVLISPLSVREKWQKTFAMCGVKHIHYFAWGSELPKVMFYASGVRYSKKGKEYSPTKMWFDGSTADYNSQPVGVHHDMDYVAPDWMREKAVANRDVSIQRKTAPNQWREFMTGQTKFMLIIDEAHRANNFIQSRSAQAVATNLVGKLAEYTMVLTGTPIPNGNAVDLLNQLEIVKHPLAGNRDDYLSAYCNPDSLVVNGSTITTYKGVTNVEELHQRLFQVPYISIIRTQDVVDLPPIERTFVSVTPPPAMLTDYRNRVRLMQESFLERLREGLVKMTNEQLLMLHFARISAAKAKAPATVELALSLLRKGEPVVIFSNFTQSLNLIRKGIERAGFATDTLSGEVDAVKRQTIADNFQAEKRPTAMLITTAAGEGVDLFAACHLILNDRTWAGLMNCQIEARIHRQGQKRDCHTYWMQFANAVDKFDGAVDELVLRKMENASRILLDSASDLSYTVATEGDGDSQETVDGDIMSLLFASLKDYQGMPLDEFNALSELLEDNEDMGWLDEEEDALPTSDEDLARQLSELDAFAKQHGFSGFTFE